MERDDRNAMAAIARRLADEGRGHADPEELVAYHEGRLDEAKAESLRDHLAVCPECVELLRDFESFAELGSSPGRPVPGRPVPTSDLWRSIQGRLAGKTATPSPRFLPALAAAAVLVLVAATVLLAVALRDSRRSVATLAERNAELEDQIGQLTQPQLELPTVTLRPPGFTRGSEAVTVLEVPAGTGFFAVTLVPPGDALTEEAKATGYRLEILDRQGRRLFRDGGLKKTAVDTFSVVLPRGFLPAGHYRLRLFGPGKEGAQLLQEYELEVRYSARSGS